MTDPALVGLVGTLGAASIGASVVYLTRSKSRADPVQTLVDAYAAADARADKAEQELALLKAELSGRPVNLAAALARAEQAEQSLAALRTELAGPVNLRRKRAGKDDDR